MTHFRIFCRAFREGFLQTIFRPTWLDLAIGAALTAAFMEFVR